MRSLVLVALVLQLLLILTEAKEKYEFGDLISFKRRCICKGTSYKHFAVYVGNMTLPGKETRQNIFQRTGKKGGPVDCGFGVLKKESGVGAKDNYLDRCFKGETFTPNRTQMIERIKYWNDPANCGNYNLLKNNCEHLATHVRYNYKVLMQPGTAAGVFYMMTAECKKLLEAMEDNERRRDECNNNCSSQSHLTTIVVPIVIVLLFILLFVVVYVLRRRRVICPTREEPI